MKYMGSKRALLKNGLGELLNKEVPKASRFVDMFLGTGEVASFVAQRHAISVVGLDLQRYSVVLAQAVIGRSSALRWQPIWESWNAEATKFIVRSGPAPTVRNDALTLRSVRRYREWCALRVDLPITKAYGGHYFSPTQAVWFDAFRSCLPVREPAKTVALAALIHAASQCAASPGHTAQPFQPTRTARSFLLDAWLRNVPERVKTSLADIAGKFGKKAGTAQVIDANEAAKTLKEGELVFLDPPYSGVQYSRFYHVLETLAHGQCSDVSGTGRYPSRAERPTSRYSLVGQSRAALNELLSRIASNGASAILTFPDHDCSNGLSGDIVRQIASAYFRVSETKSVSVFSTLGGRGAGSKKVARRKARHDRSELTLLLRPK